MKTCSSCKKEKAFDNFYVDKRTPDNKAYCCKSCQQLRQKISRTKNIERYKREGPSLEKKQCFECKELLPSKNFSADRGSRDGKLPYCKSCNILRAKKHYNKIRKFIAKQKNYPCMDCGNNYPSVCMDFDHRDPKNKIAGVSTMVHYKKSVILAEIAKCDLICSNCHRIRTWLS